MQRDFTTQLQEYRDLVRETTESAHAALSEKQRVEQDLGLVEQQLREKEARVRELQRENDFLSKSLNQKEMKKTKPSRMEMQSLKVANESMLEEIKLLSESLSAAEIGDRNTGDRNEVVRVNLVAQLQTLQDELHEKERKLSMLSASFEESLSKEARKLAESFDQFDSPMPYRHTHQRTDSLPATPFTPQGNTSNIVDTHFKSLSEQLRQKDTQLAALAAANDALTMANAVLSREGVSRGSPAQRKMFETPKIGGVGGTGGDISQRYRDEEKNDLENKIKRLESENKVLTIMNQRGGGGADGGKRFQHQQEIYEDEIRDLNEKIKFLSEEVRRNDAASAGEYKTLNSVATTLRDQLETSTDILARKEALIRQLQEALAESQTDREKSAAKLRTQMEINSQLSIELQSAHGSNGNLTAQVQALLAQISSLQNLNTKINDDVNNLLQEKSRLEDEERRRKQEIDSLRRETSKDFREMEKHVQTRERESVEKEVQIRQLTISAQNVVSEIQAVQKEKEELEILNHHNVKKYVEIQRQLISSERDLAIAEKRISDLEAERDRERLNFSVAERERADTKISLTEFSQRMGELEARNEEIKIQSIYYQTQLHDSQALVKSLQLDLSEQRKRNQDLQNEIDQRQSFLQNISKHLQRTQKIQGVDPSDTGKPPSTPAVSTPLVGPNIPAGTPSGNPAVAQTPISRPQNESYIPRHIPSPPSPSQPPSFPAPFTPVSATHPPGQADLHSLPGTLTDEIPTVSSEQSRPFGQSHPASEIEPSRAPPLPAAPAVTPSLTLQQLSSLVSASSSLSASDGGPEHQPVYFSSTAAPPPAIPASFISRGTPTAAFSNYSVVSRTPVVTLQEPVLRPVVAPSPIRMGSPPSRRPGSNVYS